MTRVPRLPHRLALLAVFALAPLSLRAQTTTVTIPAGRYVGLVEGKEAAEIGAVSVLLTRSGAGSGVATLGTERKRVLRISGVGSDGALAIARISDPHTTASLSLVTPAGGVPRITGSITAAGVTYPVSLTRLSPLTAAQNAGAYTFAFDNSAASALTSEPLAGVASGAVGPRGGARLLGVLADGSIFTAGGALNEAGAFQWYVRARRTGALLSGTVQFTGASTQPAGDAHWVHGTDTAELAIIGSHYRPGLRFNATGSWTLLAESSSDPALDTVATGLAASGGAMPRLQGGGTAAAVAVLMPASGFVGGRYVSTLSGTPKTERLLGVVLQSDPSVVGMVVSVLTVKGQFQITPATSAGTPSRVDALNFRTPPVVILSGGSLQVTGNPGSSGGPALNSGDSSGVIKTGNGSLIIGGTGTFTGGTISTGPGAVLGGGNVTLDGGLVTSGSGVLTGGSGAVTGVSISGGSGTLTGSGNVTSTGGSVTGVLTSSGSSGTLTISSLDSLSGKSLLVPAGFTVVLPAIPEGWMVTLGGQPVTGTFVVPGAAGETSLLQVTAPAAS